MFYKYQHLRAICYLLGLSVCFGKTECIKIKFELISGMSHVAQKGYRRAETPFTDLNYFDYGEGYVTTHMVETPCVDMCICITLQLFHSGNVYKLLLGWTEGLPYKKWTKDESTEISEELISIQLPTEIHRRFRPLDALHFWKASELASFLHYGVIVVLQDRIGLLVYEHFKLLYCALALLSSSLLKVED